MKQKIHHVLIRQLERFELSESKCPSNLAVWRKFLDRVNRAYVDLDNERYLSERSQKISEDEMQALYLRLQDKTNRLEAIFDQAAEGIITLNHQGIIESANPHMSKIFGFSNKEMVGHHFIMLIPPNTTTMFKDDFIKYLAGGESIVVNKSFIEALGLHKDGHVFNISLAVTEIPNTDKPLFVTIVRDISLEKDLQNKNLINTRLAGMAEVANSVLHNVGNVLNSMGVSITLLKNQIAQAKVLEGFYKMNGLLKEHSTDLPRYLSIDPKGKKIPQYLILLEEALRAEYQNLFKEIESIENNYQHIKSVVSRQQTLGGRNLGVIEPLLLSHQIDAAIDMIGFDDNYKITRNYIFDATIYTDRVKLIQILTNIIRNAMDAMTLCTPKKGKHLIVNIKATSDEYVKIDIIDNGMGIRTENLEKIFSFGFTTKAKGHGYGLHNSALLAKEMGGSLTAKSKGLNHGATFTLKLPFKPHLNEEDKP